MKPKNWIEGVFTSDELDRAEKKAIKHLGRGDGMTSEIIVGDNGLMIYYDSENYVVPSSTFMHTKDETSYNMRKSASSIIGVTGTPVDDLMVYLLFQNEKIPGLASRVFMEVILPEKWRPVSRFKLGCLEDVELSKEYEKKTGKKFEGRATQDILDDAGITGMEYALLRTEAFDKAYPYKTGLIGPPVDGLTVRQFSEKRAWLYGSPEVFA